MKKKIVGIFVCSLLICATVIPVAGNIKIGSTSPLLPIDTSVDNISPYKVPSSPLKITATGPSDLDDVALFYRWSADNISWTGIQEFSIFEGFESGTQNTDLWNTYQSSGTGSNPRIQWNYGSAHSGSYSCAMDDYDIDQTDYEWNIIYTNYDFTEGKNINIEFWQRHWDDESRSAPESWPSWDIDDPDFDVVAFTNDGNTWFEIVSAAELNSQTWKQYQYNISDDPDFSSPVNSNFAIAFQQYDNYRLTNDGRAWDDITIDYITGGPSKNWSIWEDSSNPDTSYPWSWDFNFPHSTGYYEFYSIGRKTGEDDETPPIVADAQCRFNRIPEIFDENPEDGSTDIPIFPQLDISISDADGDTMTIIWYSNSEGTWEPFGSNINVGDGTYSQTNSNFSDFDTTYWWYVTVTDDIYTISSPIFHFTTEENLPPYTPSAPDPEDGATNVWIEAIVKCNGGDPNSGDTVTYDVYFGTNSPPPLVKEDIGVPAYDPDTMEYGTTYYWQIVSEDSQGLTTTGPIWHFTTEFEANEPPTAPDIYGPPNGPPGVELFWAFVSHDYDGDQIQYIIEWGDGKTDETDYYPEGIAGEASHTYEEEGGYTIKAKAKDEKGLVGEESTFEVTITRTRTVYHPLLLRLFERFPMLERLLDLIRLC